MASDLNRGEIVTKAADYLSRSLTAVTKSGSTVESILQEMYEWSQIRLARAYSFPELDEEDTTTADTVDGTAQYSFTTLFGAGARVKEIMSLVVEDGSSSVKLKRVLYRRLRKSVPDPSQLTEGRPNTYTRIGNYIELFPIPDAAYDIHTIRSNFPTRATSDATYSDFEYKDDLLIIGTVVEFLTFYKEFEEAASANSIWKTKLTEALNTIVHPTDWEPEGRAFGSGTVFAGDYWAMPNVRCNL